MTVSRPRRRVLIIGGGIAGLSAALRLRDTHGDDVDITIVEQKDRLGGKIATGEFAGRPIETGAEAFLARRREVVDLADRVGLSQHIRHPASAPAGLVIDGTITDLPRGTMMGVPADPAAVAGVIGPAGLDRMRREPESSAPLLPAGEDIAVGELVRRQLGDEPVDRLVDPLLGGVYAGRADDLSLEVTIPALAAAVRKHRRLTEAVRAVLPTGPPSSAPVFGTIEGGLSRLIEAVAAASLATVRLGLPVRRLERTPTGWSAVVGATVNPYRLSAEDVVIAVPARPAARLLTDVDTTAAELVGELDYASLGLVSLAFSDIDLPPRSGFLVPATEGLTIKAATFFTRKWPHLATDPVTVLRASIGRHGNTEALRRDDTDLVGLTVAELSTVLRRRLPAPIDVAVHRWGGALPQYGPGHRDRIRRVRSRLAGHRIALAGAAFDGVGIPACVASGQAAADHLSALDWITNSGPAEPPRGG